MSTAEAFINPTAAAPRAVTPERATDFALAQRAAEGDMQAFEELFRRHRRLVYGLCLRMTQDVAEAEDVTQEVFVLLFRKNKSRREDALEDEDLRPHESVRPTSPKASQMIDRITLESAIAKLPPGYRAAFILHDVEGYEHEEVARIMGCAVGTSKSQLHKARTKLRKLLATR